MISVLHPVAGCRVDVLALALLELAPRGDVFVAVLEEPAAGVEVSVFGVPFKETSHTPSIVITGEFSGTAAVAVDGGVDVAGAGLGCVEGVELCAPAGFAGTALGEVCAATNDVLARKREQKKMEWR